VLEWRSALLFQAQVRLVYQGGALQSVVGAFVAQVMMRDPSQLFINKRDHSAKGFLVTCMPVR